MLARPLPPFAWETAIEKVRAVEDNWNSRQPSRVARDYSIDSFWRNRLEFLSGRASIEAFLTHKWANELEYRLISEMWVCAGNRLAIRFAYEYQNDNGEWFRAYGNENWEIDPSGLIRWRIASVDEHPIANGDRMLSWPLGRRPDDHPELSDFDW